MKQPKSKRSYFEQLQILALTAVEVPDWDYFLRKVHRAFSIAFHVPITECEKLTTEYMLQHLWEHRFENMETADQVKAAKELMKTPEERELESKEELRRLDEDEAYAVTENERYQKEADTKKTKGPRPTSPAPKIQKEAPPTGLHLQFDPKK